MSLSREAPRRLKPRGGGVSGHVVVVHIAPTRCAVSHTCHKLGEKMRTERRAATKECSVSLRVAAQRAASATLTSPVQHLSCSRPLFSLDLCRFRRFTTRSREPRRALQTRPPAAATGCAVTNGCARRPACMAGPLFRRCGLRLMHFSTAPGWLGSSELGSSGAQCCGCSCFLIVHLGSFSRFATTGGGGG